MREDRLATACLAIARRLRGQPSRHRNESPLLLHIVRAPHPLGSGFAHGPRDPMRFSPPPCPPPSTGKRLAARWRPSGSLNFTGARLSDWRSATGRTARRVLFLANGGNSVTGSCLPAWRRAFAARYSLRTSTRFAKEQRSDFDATGRCTATRTWSRSSTGACGARFRRVSRCSMTR